ncbi:MAG: GTP-binding protein [Ruminococcus sp.]|nr:GTP-binding protein [Ruminococcus sp.]
MKKIIAGITAHVDSGKTTLSEAMLYRTGEIRKLGRVDYGSSYLDTDSIERDRGITIFAHQASMQINDTKITLLDTPGHVDFSSETERTMQVLDYAVLVISGTDGVQSHTETLWKLLEKYSVPVFIFVNKMDMEGADKNEILAQLKKKLSSCCADFSVRDEAIAENAASCCEILMEKYFESGELTDNDIAESIAKRRVFPCCFGSALKLEGVDEFLRILERFTIQPQRGTEFAAKVFKISADSKGSRLTYMKICGGSLSVRDEITYKSADGREISEKVSSVRLYSGEKFRSTETVSSGEICAVTGLSAAYAGQGLGAEPDSGQAFLEPVMSYHAVIPDNINIHDALGHMRTLEAEDPQLHIIWNEQLRQIHVHLMGEVQLEVLSRIIPQRFGYEVQFENGAVTYRETIAGTVEGVGHYEPLRHYAEVHLLLEPLERGSGLHFECRCRDDDLDRNWQRLIMTHLEEKTHIGALTGSPITDMKIIIASGKAHLKHTEGGDFRQATYRAVRQGLRSAESILLEPYYEYRLEVPTEYIGRAMTDIQNMCGSFNPPETDGEMSVISGSAPVSKMNGYQAEVTGYTRGKGRISFSNGGYHECHNSDEVIAKIGYDCDGDIENSADSVFCAHGAGFNVKWDEVPQYMHLPSAMGREIPDEEEHIVSYRRAESYAGRVVEDKELMEIFERTYGKIDRDPRKAFQKVKKELSPNKAVKLPVYNGPDYLLVDGYNIIFAWDELKKLAEKNLDDARVRLCDMLCGYQGYRQCEVIVVFDAYKVKGGVRSVEKYANITVVYTRESETADSYIEKTSHDLSKKHRVRVATSDGLEQIIILGSGAMRVSADELLHEVKSAEKAVREYIETMNMKK